VRALDLKVRLNHIFEALVWLLKHINDAALDRVFPDILIPAIPSVPIRVISFRGTSGALDTWLVESRLCDEDEPLDTHQYLLHGRLFRPPLGLATAFPGA